PDESRMSRKRAIELLSTAWMVWPSFTAVQLPRSLKTDLVFEHANAGDDPAYRKQMDQLLFALDARAELNGLLATESDDAARPRLFTYAAIIADAPNRTSRDGGSLLNRCAADPRAIAQASLDPQTVLEVLWQADWFGDYRSMQSGSWRNELSAA